mgnify:CR=1 FL=1
MDQTVDFESANRFRFLCFGFSLWKQNYARRYLYSPQGEVHFLRRLSVIKKIPIDDRTRIVTWGLRGENELLHFAADRGIPVLRMEDGFLRSIGLGSDLTAPASLVLDTRGIYYDPTGPSDLEHILQNEAFSEKELARARELREQIVALKISKYNLDGADALKIPEDRKSRVLLVPGQVEDDASIQLGTVDVRTNFDLLKAVRAQNPEAFILFKPHPDVVSGNRKGQVPADAARQLADLVVEDASISRCLDVATEVHTMTSLVGFEGLLRGLPVHAFGRPFYAGWGLTVDRHGVHRRTRRLQLDELVAGALIRYPRYMDPDTFAFTTPENIVLRLQRARDGANRQIPIRASRPVRQLRRLMHVIKALLNAR